VIVNVKRASSCLCLLRNYIEIVEYAGYEANNTGIKEDEPSTGRVWATGIHHVMARSRLARVLKLMNLLFL
jgi:hypothetical protein